MNTNLNPNFSFLRNTPPLTPNIITNNPIRTMPLKAPGINLLGGLKNGAVANTIGNTSKITFSSILNGTSKTLGVINQAIPIFYQIKPIWNNAKTMFKVAKEINSKDDNTIEKPKIDTNNKKIETNNAPTFFI